VRRRRRPGLRARRAGARCATPSRLPPRALQCFESPTSVKFFLTARPRLESAAAAYLARVYEAYADYVLKNPFYETDMPIRIKLFDIALEKALKDVLSQ
jgi:hypothetical protein